MSQKKTPLLQQPRQDSGTVYVFPSASEDVGLNISSDVNGVALTHYALLNIPSISLEKLCFGKDTELYELSKELQEINPNQLLAMSLQNYAMNFETVLLNEESYNYQNTKTVSERVFWHWMKAIGAMKLGKDDIQSVSIDDNVYYYYLNGDNRIVQCFGSIDSGNKVHSEFGMYNETYINVPSSYGAGPVFFSSVFDENYAVGSYGSQSTVTLAGRENDVDFISYSNGHDKPYFDDVTTNKYVISKPDASTEGSEFEAMEIVKDFDTISKVISAIIPDESAPYITVSYDELNVDARDQLYDKQYKNESAGLDKGGAKLVKTEFDFNAILLYYSIYDQTDKVSRVHATNLFGIIFLDGADIITGTDTTDRRMFIPTLHKRKSTTESFGTGYSFRVNIKTLSIFDDSDGVIQDNTTVASVNADSFNGAVQAMNRAIDIMNSNVYTTAKIQDQYAKIINIYDEQRIDINDISTLLHDYIEGRTNPILNVDKLYTNDIYSQVNSQDGTIRFYTPNLGVEGYYPGDEDNYLTNVYIAPTGLFTEKTYGGTIFEKQYFVIRDIHTADYPVFVDLTQLKQSITDTALANKIKETRELIYDMFNDDAVEINIRSVTEEANINQYSEGGNEIWERYKFDLYINPESKAFNSDSGIAHLKVPYQPDDKPTELNVIDYVGLIPYMIAGIQDANKYTYAPLDDEIESIGDVTKTKDAISYLVKKVSDLQEGGVGSGSNNENIDLSNYITKQNFADFNSEIGQSVAGIVKSINYGDIKSGEIILPLAGKNTAGLMTAADKQKLDGLNMSDIMGGFVTYGYTMSATPLINSGESFESYKARNPKPVGTPISLADKASASKAMPYIWMRASNYDNWEIIDAYYVTAGEVIQSKLGETKITPSLGYGSVVIDTDLTWSMFPVNKGGTGWSTSKSDALLFYPAVVIDPEKIGGDVSTGLETSYISEGDVNTQFALTLERWDRNDKTSPVLNNKMALQQIFNAISSPTGEFDWGTFSSYYPSNDIPLAPIVIKFTNGVFTLQDMHNLEVDETTNELKRVSLYGSLTVFNSMNAYLQSSHGNLNKYRVDTGLKIELAKSSCSMKLGSNYSNSYTVVTLLPQAG